MNNKINNVLGLDFYLSCFTGNNCKINKDCIR